MCRHVLNAKVFIQASCCQGWFECFECHDDLNNHPFKSSRLLRLTCKPCRRVFQKDLGMLMESDKFCEQCKVQWCVPGVTPESVIYYEARDTMEGTLNALIDSAGKKL